MGDPKKGVTEGLVVGDDVQTQFAYASSSVDNFRIRFPNIRLRLRLCWVGMISSFNRRNSLVGCEEAGSLVDSIEGIWVGRRSLVGL